MRCAVGLRASTSHFVAFSHTYVAIVKRECERDSTSNRSVLDAYDHGEDDDDENRRKNNNKKLYTTPEMGQRREMKKNRREAHRKKVQNVMEQQNAENCVESERRHCNPNEFHPIQHKAKPLTDKIHQATGQIITIIIMNKCAHAIRTTDRNCILLCAPNGRLHRSCSF